MGLKLPALHTQKLTGFAEVKRLARKLAYGILNDFQRLNVLPMRLRGRIVRLMGHNLSDMTHIADRCYFKGTGLRTQGFVVMNTGCHIDAAGEIILEENVGLACEVMIITSQHQIGPRDHRYGDSYTSPVRIGAGTWVCARAIITPGVTVAPGCIILTGAVVASDTEADGIYGGVPARRIRDLSDDNVHELPVYLASAP